MTFSCRIILTFLFTISLSAQDVTFDLLENIFESQKTLNTPSTQFEVLFHNNPSLVTDLGVGLWAWPLPMDFDNDGDFDLVVSCHDKPYNGTYLFENKSGGSFPVFEKARKIGPGFANIQVSYIDGVPRILIPGKELRYTASTGLVAWKNLSIPRNVHIWTKEGLPFKEKHKIRSNQWKYIDFDEDGDLDVVIGVGDWHDYGWDDAYNAAGQWTNGPLRGLVYLVLNTGSATDPTYAAPRLLYTSAGEPVEVFGRPSPNFADFDQDGDLDLLCGEFLDRFTYFENQGTRKKPIFAPGRFLQTTDRLLTMDLQMVTPVVLDWDRDGDIDIVSGDEDGRVAFIENTGQLQASIPQFKEPRYFQQKADRVKFGALATPFGFDWDGDGDMDIVAGNTAGYVAFIENLGGGSNPRWAAPSLLNSGGKPLRILAGPSGSIQGPAEAKWGYTTLSVGNWDTDDLPDLIVNSIWGAVQWYRNVGTRKNPKLEEGRFVEVDWPGHAPKPSWVWWTPKVNQLVTQWRTTPVVIDWNHDGLNDLVMLDHEGYLSLFARFRTGEKLGLRPGQHVFTDEHGKPLRLNSRHAGKSGRRKLQIVDWDGDGLRDILLNSQNADLLKNLGSDGDKTRFRNLGAVSQQKLSGHSTSPTVVDWNGDTIPDLLLGTESGFFYHLKNPRSKGK